MSECKYINWVVWWIKIEINKRNLKQWENIDKEMNSTYSHLGKSGPGSKNRTPSVSPPHMLCHGNTLLCVVPTSPDSHKCVCMTQLYLWLFCFSALFCWTFFASLLHQIFCLARFVLSFHLLEHFISITPISDLRFWLIENWPFPLSVVHDDSKGWVGNEFLPVSVS